EAGGAGRGRRTAFALPGVDAEMMVVTTRRKERGLRSVAGGELETEDAAIEGERALDIGHLQMDVTDPHARIDRLAERGLRRPGLADDCVIGHLLDSLRRRAWSLSE